MNAVKLPRAIVNQILQHAQAHPSHEVCGLIGRSQKNAFFCYPIRNVSETPESAFLMDAQQQLSAFRTLQESGQALFAIYHSHPNAEAVPSLRDREMAYYPGTVYLIISLNIKGVLQMRAYHLQNHVFNEVQLEI
jgi:proteasome lid subunit RPN8/RPN11